MLDAAFVAHGIEAAAELCELDAGELPHFVELLREPEWLGFQVTAPYKQAVMPLLDEIEPEAQAVAAVNTGVRLHDGRLVGLNTDVAGFLAAVETELEVGLSGARVAIVGAGGAARAAAYACVKAGVAELAIGNRSHDAARVLARHLSAGGTTVRAFQLDSAPFLGSLGEADLVVNATTVGMLAAGAPIDSANLKPSAVLFDMIFVPSETELVRSARARGLRASNGVPMLVAQAAIAFERWTGLGGTEQVMRAAIEPLLADATLSP
jgi:shikimate dehydrogenase